MSDPKHTPGPDARLPEAGPHTTLDNENPDKGMPYVGAVLLYQLPSGYSRPFIATSVHSQDEHASGWLLPDARLDGPPTGLTFFADVPFGTTGQAHTWHWPIKTYTGRSDAPGLTPVDSVEHTQEVSGNATLPLEGRPADQVEQDFSPADLNKDGVVSHKEAKDFKKKHQG